MKDLTIWCTYHKETQIEQYGLQEDDIVRLFNSNNTLVEGDNINYLNPFYSELVTLYWVWKNNVRSRLVGFCHYRRKFTKITDVKPGECQVLAINRNCHVFGHYKSAHNYQDFYDAVDILNKRYGECNKYVHYMLESRTFIPFCCFIMHWEDFNRLCQFLFPILDDFDKKNGLGMNAERYMDKVIRDFRYDNIMYQRRAVSFLAERLISCFLICEMNAYCVNEI